MLNEGTRSEAVWANCGYTAATLLHLCINEGMLFATKASEILCTSIAGLEGGQHVVSRLLNSGQTSAYVTRLSEALLSLLEAAI